MISMGIYSTVLARCFEARLNGPKLFHFTTFLHFYWEPYLLPVKRKINPHTPPTGVTQTKPKVYKETEKRKNNTRVVLINTFFLQKWNKKNTLSRYTNFFPTMYREGTEFHYLLWWSGIVSLLKKKAALYKRAWSRGNEHQWSQYLLGYYRMLPETLTQYMNVKRGLWELWG